MKLWAYEDQTAQNINQYRENKVFLPGVAIPEGIQDFRTSSRLLLIVKHLCCFPGSKNQGLIREFKTVLTSNHQFVLAGKRIERSGSLLHEIFEEELGSSGNVSILSGPTFAMEVTKNQQQLLLHQPILNWKSHSGYDAWTAIQALPKQGSDRGSVGRGSKMCLPSQQELPKECNWV